MSSPSSLSYKDLPPPHGENVDKLVILLHGVSTDADDIMMLGQVIRKGPVPPKNVHFVAPDAPHAYDNKAYPEKHVEGGHQWFSLQQQGDDKNLVRDPERILTEIRETAPIVDAFIDEQMARFNLQPKDVVLVGLSQGAMMALHVGPRRKESLGGVVSMAGTMIGHETLADEIQSHPPLYFVHGMIDDVVPIGRMIESQDACGKLGIENESQCIDRLGHEVNLEMIKATDRYIKQAFAQRTPDAAGVRSIRHTAPDKSSKPRNLP